MYRLENRIELIRDPLKIDSEVARVVKKLMPDHRRRDMIIETLDEFTRLVYCDNKTTLYVKVQGENLENHQVGFLQFISQKSLIPELIGIVKNGYICNISSLKCGNLTASLLMNVATKLAAYHRTISKVGQTFQIEYKESEQISVIRKMLDEELDKTFIKHSQDVNHFRMELDELEIRCSQARMETILSHNNVDISNIFYNENTGEVYLGGAENSRYNWQGWDLGVILTEMVLLAKPFFTEKGFQSNWIKSYLSEYEQVDLTEIPDSRLKGFISQVHLCCLVYLLREIVESACKKRRRPLIISAREGGQQENVEDHRTFVLHNLYRQIKCNIIGINI